MLHSFPYRALYAVGNEGLHVLVVLKVRFLLAVLFCFIILFSGYPKCIKETMGRPKYFKGCETWYEFSTYM